MIEAWRRVPGFLAAEEVARLQGVAQGNAALFVRTAGKGGLGPRYRVMDGETIRARAPELMALEAERVRPAVAAFAGAPVELLASARRSVRLQLYETRRDGFRWHLDAHPYAALVTLANTNDGRLHVVSPQLSRWLRFLLYPLYPLPGLFSLAPHRPVLLAEGDLLLFRGGTVLHRSVTPADSGRRLLLFFAYDEPGHRPNPLRDLAARWLNY